MEKTAKKDPKMAKNINFSFQKVAQKKDFLQLNSFVHCQLEADTIFLEHNLSYNVFVFDLSKSNESVELYLREEAINLDFLAGSTVVFYSFLDYLPIDITHWQLDGLKQVKQLKLMPEVVEMLDETRYFKEFPEHNFMFNEKVVLALEKTTKKELFRGFMYPLITSIMYSIAKHVKVAKFRAEKYNRKLTIL